MKRVKSWRELLRWHKSEHHHPIFDPNFARENLISMAETIFAVWVSIFMLGLLIRGLWSFNIIEADSLLTMISDAIIKSFFLELFTSDVANFALTLIIYSFLFFIMREGAEIYKALEHPKEQ